MTPEEIAAELLRPDMRIGGILRFHLHQETVQELEQAIATAIKTAIEEDRRQQDSERDPLWD